MQQIDLPLKKVAVAVFTAIFFTLPAHADNVALFDGKSVASVVTDGAANTPIRKAAELLAHDLTSLSGKRPAIASSYAGLSGPAVIIGTADTPSIAALLRANHIDAAPIAGKWETYGRAVMPAPWNPKASALLIFGSDTRGTIWGVIDLTREMGVSAWEWWADVKIRKRRADRRRRHSALLERAFGQIPRHFPQRRGIRAVSLGLENLRSKARQYRA